MAFSWIQPSFAGGEIGPSLYGRIDMSKYQVALRKCDNFIVRQYGGGESPGHALRRRSQISDAQMPPYLRSSSRPSRPMRWSSGTTTCA
jgi:hypothetical protein